MAQINIRIWKSLATRFSDATKKAFLRRDPFLADVLAHELPRIDDELVGLVNSESAHRFIAQRLELATRVPITLVLPQAVVKLLKKVCERHNLVRDALFNRLFFFLAYSPDAVARLFSMSDDALRAIVGEEIIGTNGNPTSFDNDWIRPRAFRSTTPLQLAKQLVMSPLDPYRALLDVLQDPELNLAANNSRDWKDTSLSSLSFCGVADSEHKPHLAGLNLFARDVETPGTSAYEARHAAKKADLHSMMREIADL